MPLPDLPAVLAQENRRLADVVTRSDPETAVPSCPGWTLGELAAHVGRGHRWAAMLVRERATARLDPRSAPGATPGPDLGAWLLDSAAETIDAVAATGGDTPVWTFLGPRPARWWLRRRLHETVVHRADAALAVGAPFEVEPAVAADAVAEWLDLLAGRGARGSAPPLPEGASLHLHATDEGLGEAGEWTVRAAGDGGEGITWEHGHGKGSAAVRGTAADLLLALLRRIPADDGRLAVFGDRVVLDTWLARTPF